MSSLRYSCSSSLCGAPGEVAVGLREAELGQRLHDLRPREGLGQEDHVGIARLDFVDQPFPERQRLGVRVVDAENPHALLDPEQHDVAQRLPQRDAVGAVEIRIDDVLVFLRRVLGVSDRAVGPPLEPFRMLLEPGMVGRALHGEVERDLHVRAAAGLDQAAEIVERAELRMDRVVAALPAADRVEAAGIVRAGLERIVLALAVGLADRMDRRQIEHVEAERGDLRHPRDAIVERAVLARHRALAARHHFVPGAGAGARAVDDQRHGVAAGEVAARRLRRRPRPSSSASKIVGVAAAVELPSARASMSPRRARIAEHSVRRGARGPRAPQA